MQCDVAMLSPSNWSVITYYEQSDLKTKTKQMNEKTANQFLFLFFYSPYSTELDWMPQLNVFHHRSNIPKLSAQSLITQMFIKTKFMALVMW